MNKKITFELAKHNNKPVILIKFDYDKLLVERVKKLVGVKWVLLNKLAKIRMETF